MLARAEFFRVGFGGVAGECPGGDFYLGKFLKDPDEVFPWVDLPAAAAYDEGAPDGVALSGFLAAHEEPGCPP